MRAEQIAEEFPVVDIDSPALEVARMLAEHRLPGIVVLTSDGQPYAVMPDSEVVCFIVPDYVQDDPLLAGVLTESMADRAAEKLGGKTVREVLSRHRPPLPAANADDTIIEVAAIMARLRSPLIAVMKQGKLHGVITASRLLAVALHRSIRAGAVGTMCDDVKAGALSGDGVTTAEVDDQSRWVTPSSALAGDPNAFLAPGSLCG